MLPLRSHLERQGNRAHSVDQRPRPSMGLLLPWLRRGGGVDADRSAAPSRGEGGPCADLKGPFHAPRVTTDFHRGLVETQRHGRAFSQATWAASKMRLVTAAEWHSGKRACEPLRECSTSTISKRAYAFMQSASQAARLTVMPGEFRPEGIPLRPPRASVDAAAQGWLVRSRHRSPACHRAPAVHESVGKGVSLVPEAGFNRTVRIRTILRACPFIEVVQASPKRIGGLSHGHLPGYARDDATPVPRRSLTPAICSTHELRR